MDSWEVKGTLRLVVGYEPCKACEGLSRSSCYGHAFYVDVAEVALAEAEDAAGAFDRARQVVIERELGERGPSCAVDSADWECNPEPTAINVSALARERAALAAWNMGLPIPGGPPIEWGPRDG